jgi:hypothetical protein
MSIFNDRDRMETFKIDVDGMACKSPHYSSKKGIILTEEALSMLVRDLQKCDIQIWVSRNEQLQNTNVIVYNTLPQELRDIQEAIRRSFFQRLAFHPIFIFVIAMDSIHRSLLYTLKWAENDALDKITNPEEINRSRGGGMEAKNMDIEVESGLALYRQHSTVQLMADIQMALRALTQLKSWCKDFDNRGGSPERQEFFRDAGAIIQARLAHIEDTLRHFEVNTTKVLAFTQAYKQSVRYTPSPPMASL